MKVALCTVPKSGTYLVANFLEEVGIENSKLHLNDYEFSDYTTASTHEARVNPEKFRVEKPFSEAVANLKDNKFIVGHFSVENRKYLRDFKTIFLYRNLKYCCVSFGFWTLRTSRWLKYEKDSDWRQSVGNKKFIVRFLKFHGESLFTLFGKTVPWIKESGIVKLQYEILIGDLGKTKQIEEFRKLSDYLGLSLTQIELETKIANTLNKNSLTKSEKKTDYDYYITKELQKNLKKLGIMKLNRMLGFNDRNLSLRSLFRISKPKSFYDRYWKSNKTSKNTWSYGINIVDNLISNYSFKTVLDAGCGSGDVVRYLLEKGYEAKGVELSGDVLKNFSSDLLKKGIVQKGSLTSLPFKDNSFDVIFSSEVLEHISEEDIPVVISEFYRVAKKVVFLTISLRPSSSFNKYHITLKDRSWWESKFEKAGFIKENNVLSKLQRINKEASVEEVLELGPTKTHIHEMEWFIENPPYDFNGELEPWYFIFTK